jgi:tetratricopeptide (TPR) repeat protein
MQNETRDITSLAEKAVQLHRSGKLDDAAAIYHDILALDPHHGAVLHNLGVISAARGDHVSAIARFDEALAANARYLPAHIHRAMSAEALGNVDGAIRGFEQVCHADPGHYGAHRALGFLWLRNHDIDKSLDHFSRTTELRRGIDRTGIADQSLTHATRDKLIHDSEQFRYLSLLGSDRPRFAALAQAYGEVAGNFPKTLTELNETQTEQLGETYNTAAYRYDASEQAGNVLSIDAAGSAGDMAFGLSKPGALILDDLLTPGALESLQKYLLRSTIWHDFTHIQGHVASYLEDGLACPLLLQIADEIRRRYPDLLGDHPLSQAWAFKGLYAGASIGPHADDAVVSVNFWVTPNKANLNSGGGLSICLEPPPIDWTLEDYNNDQSRSAEFMALFEANTLNVPYRENRAVMFQSRLLHQSDAPHFAEGYENHRINISLLYGRPDQDSNKPLIINDI